jgi:hypothetical protein
VSRSTAVTGSELPFEVHIVEVCAADATVKNQDARFVQFKTVGDKDEVIKTLFA